MKKLILLPTLLFLTFHINAQVAYEWEKFNMEFISPLHLEITLDDNDPNYFEGENNRVSVSIDVIPFKDLSSEYLRNAKVSSQQVIVMMDYESVQTGEYLTNFKEAHYSLTEDFEDDDFGKKRKYDVIVGVVMDRINKVAFEIVIECYEISLEDGLAIIKSFKFSK